MSDEKEKEVNVDIPKVKVTDEEKEAFFKAFLADKPFTLTEKLFDGQFSVTFKSLDVQDSTDVFEQLRRDQTAGDITTDAVYMMRLTNYRLANAISEINGESFQKEVNRKDYKPVDGNDSYLKAKAAVFKNWPVFKLSAFAEAFKTFEDKILHLTQEIQTENFWKAAE